GGNVFWLQHGERAVSNVAFEHGFDAIGFAAHRALVWCDLFQISLEQLANRHLLCQACVRKRSAAIEFGFQIARPLLSVYLRIEALGPRRKSLATNLSLPPASEPSDRCHDEAPPV